MRYFEVQRLEKYRLPSRQRLAVMSLKQKTFSGVRWTTFSFLVRALLHLVQVVTLARLLEPADFGLIAIVMAIMAFLQMFSDAGVSSAIIHFQNITREQFSSLYWLSVAASLGIALLVALLSPLVATFFGQHALQPLLMLAALTLIISSLGQQIRIVAQKNMRFSELAKVDVTGSLSSLVTVVTVAFLGGGAYSLVAGSMMSAVVITLVVWWKLADGWRPQFRMRLGEIGEFVKFGSYMVGNNLVNVFNSQVDILLGGRLLGSHAIGLYSVPKDLSQNISDVINSIVTKVGFPVMAMAQEDVERLKRIYLSIIRMTASVNFPIYIAIGLYAPEVVHFTLGEKWQESTPLLMILAFWALLRSTGNPIGSLLMARGRAKLSFQWNTLLVLIIPPVLWVGGEFGAVGLASAALLTQLFLLVPVWLFLVRPLCGAGLVEYLSQFTTPFVIALIAGFIGFECANIFVRPDMRMIVGFISHFVFYILLSYRFNKIWLLTIREMIIGRS